MAARLLSLKSVAVLVEYDPKTIRKWVIEGKFPQPVAMPNGDHRWRRSQVMAWIDARPETVVKSKAAGNLGEFGGTDAESVAETGTAKKRG